MKGWKTVQNLLIANLLIANLLIANDETMKICAKLVNLEIKSFKATPI